MMINGDDLFLGGSRARNAPVTRPKTASVLLAEDQASFAEMRELASASVSVPSLKGRHKAIARLRINPRGKAYLIASSSAVALVIAATIGWASVGARSVGPTAKPPVVDLPVASAAPAAVSVPPDRHQSTSALTSETAAFDQKSETSTAATKGSDLKAAPPLKEVLAVTPIADPASQTSLAKKIVVETGPGEPEVHVVHSVAVPQTPGVPPVIPLPDAPKQPAATPAAEVLSLVPQQPAAAAEPKNEMSGDDFINQTGFGSVDQASAATSVDPDASGRSAPSVVPIGKPAAKDDSIRYQIIDRPGQKPGFWRMVGKDESTKQYFIVIEAVDADGKSFKVPVRSMDTGEIKPVDHWALQISKADFFRLSDDIKKNGGIKDKVVGTAASKNTMPKWSVDTMPTKGGDKMITDW